MRLQFGSSLGFDVVQGISLGPLDGTLASFEGIRSICISLVSDL